MPLMICPNDETSMQAVVRNGVEFDMCPKCRGVWLDRGELEKLMGASREEAQLDRGPVRNEPPRAPYDNRGVFGGERGERGEYGERGERGEHGYVHRRRGGIFDIFD